MTDEQLKKAMEEWNSEQDHCNDILPPESPGSEKKVVSGPAKKEFCPGTWISHVAEADDERTEKKKE